MSHLAWVLWGNPVTAMHEGHEEPSVSRYLFYHIVFSEFWDEEFEIEEYRAEVEELPFQFSSEALVALRERWTWPHYETPSELLSWAPSSVPMLLLNGDLDYQTPIWDLDDLEDTYGGAGQHFIRLPFTGHGPNHDCDRKLRSSFLADPMGALPTACVEELRNIPWAGSPPLARYLMGKDDLWGSEITVGVHAATASLAEEVELVPAVERARAELRRLEAEGVLTLPRP